MQACARVRKDSYEIRAARNGKRGERGENDDERARAKRAPRGTMDARNLLRQFKNIGNYLRLLFDPVMFMVYVNYTP